MKEVEKDLVNLKKKRDFLASELINLNDKRLQEVNETHTVSSSLKKEISEKTAALKLYDTIYKMYTAKDKHIPNGGELSKMIFEFTKIESSLGQRQVVQKDNNE